MIVYDCEIKNCIPKSGEERKRGLSYCKGWGDFSGMGISCICTYDTALLEYYVFTDDNMEHFEDYVHTFSDQTFIGFGNAHFDNALIAANVGMHIADIMAFRCYDIMRESVISVDPVKAHHKKVVMKGFSLNNFALSNSLIAKTGNGALAPELYQSGKIGQLINYCMHDVWITAKLAKLIHNNQSLIHPELTRDHNNRPNLIKMPPLIGSPCGYLHLIT